VDDEEEEGDEPQAVADRASREKKETREMINLRGERVAAFGRSIDMLLHY
jgi:hypothetical protein